MDDQLRSLAVLIQGIPISFATLLPVINPIGTAIILLSLTQTADEKTRRAIARRIGINSIVLLIVLLIGGRFLLSFFGISVPIVQAAGGMILAAMGWGLLNEKEPTSTVSPAKELPEDPNLYFSRTFYPFTFPITVGPGCVAVVLTLSAHTTQGTFVETALSQGSACLGIILSGLVVYFCVAYADRLAKPMGPRGLSVLMRLMAFIVVCIGAQISWSGIKTLIASLPGN